MKAVISVLGKNSFVVYTNENVETKRGIKKGDVRCGVNYYFCTRKGVDLVTNNDHSNCKIIPFHKRPSVQEMDSIILDFFN